MNRKRFFFLILPVFIFIAAFSVPVMAQAFGSILSPAQLAEVSKKEKERQEAQLKAQAERQKAEKERTEKMKNGQRMQDPSAKPSTTPGKQQAVNEQQQKAPTSQAERQKAEKERAENMKKLQDQNSKMTSEIRENRVKTAREIYKNFTGLMR
ncbi:MAG TPA: hypothetical protein P5244_15685 [Syntrophales bacterium]|nr:hypothetical protein [Syntrophales bacterium]